MENILAINGGKKVRESPFPPRRLFDVEELDAVKGVFENAWATGKDFGYQEKYEEIYTTSFARYQGGGFADAVSSGSAGIFVALASLGLEPKASIILSPVTDPGSISPALLLGFAPLISDSMPNSFNIGPKQLEKLAKEGASAAIITHIGGVPAPMEDIMEIAYRHNIKIIEDCSQAHGAEIKGKKVGTFGDIAVFSTMFSKNHASGGCGGIVFTKKEELYQIIRSMADRGKPFFKADYNPKDPRQALCAALNFNQDEISCAIGSATLAKLDKTILQRTKIANFINEKVARECRIIVPSEIPKDTQISPFFLSFKLLLRGKFNKKEITDALLAEGATINPNYLYVVGEWPWFKKLSPSPFSTPNATKYREKSFNLLFHENYSDLDVNDLVKCFIKVDSYFSSKE
jgi:perosamine synthetase